jgi:serine/threonine protein kinase
LFEMLAGSRPFDGQHDAQVLHEILHGEAPSPRSVVPALDPELDAVIIRMLDPRPERRYASAWFGRGRPPIRQRGGRSGTLLAPSGDQSSKHKRKPIGR